jgi:hypothetical protein
MVAALSILGVALAACGGDDDDAGAATNAPTTAVPTTTQLAAAPSTSAATAPPDSVPADSATDGSQPLAGEPDPLAYAQCMRDNGIANFPDPSADGALNLDAATLGITPDSPQFKAADEACKHLMPAPDAAGPPPAAMEAMLAYAQCMRDEGITAFPDPNPESGGIELDGDAVGIDTPQFQAADEACKHLMGDGGSTEMHGS